MASGSVKRNAWRRVLSVQSFQLIPERILTDHEGRFSREADFLDHSALSAGGNLPLITTNTSPPWLRRSDQAVTWASTMLQPHRAVVIACETTDLPGALTGKVGYENLLNRTRTCAASSHRSAAMINGPAVAVARSVWCEGVPVGNRRDGAAGKGR